MRSLWNALDWSPVVVRVCVSHLAPNDPDGARCDDAQSHVPRPEFGDLHNHIVSDQNLFTLLRSRISIVLTPVSQKSETLQHCNQSQKEPQQRVSWTLEHTAATQRLPTCYAPQENEVNRTKSKIRKR